ncbi:MAG TPA: hypothetical protein PKC30_06505 [Saprospiraceae bacterium]|nr:hypothetical protein [Saprospiraceae bacterium]
MGWASASESGENEMKAFQAIKMHDQGQQTDLLSDEGVRAGFSVQLAHFEYSPALTVLQLSIFEKDITGLLQYIRVDERINRIGDTIKSVIQTEYTIASDK